MKQVSIDKCPAGSALDTTIANVLGVPCDQWTPIAFSQAGFLKNCQHERCYPVGYPAAYSTNIEAALQLWQELAENHYVVSVCYGPGRNGRLYASVQMQLDMFLAEDLECRSPFEMDAKAETVPLAICRAFLKVHGIEFVEIPE